MRVLDLFSGLGAFSLGLERAGMQTVAFCEIDPFCRRVLAKHWPEVPCYDDVRELTAARLASDGIAADVVCGGFPCQDISVAGRGAGLDGERSGLWSEYARIIEEIRPAWVIIENVAALRSRGLAAVLGRLDTLGYDAEWHCIPASAIGAPHRRDRLWVVAYPARNECGSAREALRRPRERIGASGLCGGGTVNLGPVVGESADACASAVADPQSGGRREQWYVGSADGNARAGQSGNGRTAGAVTSRTRLALGEGTIREWAYTTTARGGWWATEPDVGRVVDGAAARVDRRKRLIALGNAVVPQLPEMIGRAIMETRT